MTNLDEANNEKKNLIQQIHEFGIKIDAYDIQQAKLSKKNESLHTLMEANIQDCDSLLNEVACFKSITCIKDKEHKIEINAMNNDLSNVLKDLTTFLRDKEKIVVYDTIQK